MVFVNKIGSFLENSTLMITIVRSSPYLSGTVAQSPRMYHKHGILNWTQMAISGLLTRSKMGYGDLNEDNNSFSFFPVPERPSGFGTIYPVSIVLDNDEIYFAGHSLQIALVCKYFRFEK